MLKSFLHGASFVFKGCRAFYKDKKALRYVILPWILTCLIYVAIVWGLNYAVEYLSLFLHEKLSQLPQWLSWLEKCVDAVISFGGIICFLLLLAVTVTTVFEVFGGLCFDPLMEYYEQKRFGISPRRMTVWENVKYGWSSFAFGMKSFLLSVFLLLCSLFLPFWGQLILVVVTGYYWGISYLIGPANNNYVTMRVLKKKCTEHFTIVLGFGVTAYLLLLIPFAALFLLPGFVLGGSDLFNTCLKNYEKE